LRDGLTPFSSWHNFGLYALALGLSMAVILSIKAYFKVKDENSDDPKEKLYYRLCVGHRVNNIRKIAVAFLTVFLVLTVIKYLHTPFPTWIMGLNLRCLGIIFGYDNPRFSRTETHSQWRKCPGQDYWYSKAPLRDIFPLPLAIAESRCSRLLGSSARL